MRLRTSWRLGLMALLAVLSIAFATTACSSVSDLQPGDCAKRTESESFLPADCEDEDARFQVLERHEDPDQSCYNVAGVTHSHRVSRSGVEICLGPKDVDPATAINVAQPGDCVTGIHSPAPDPDFPSARRVDCAAPEASYRILDRVGGSSLQNDECAKVPGTTTSYSWWLHNPDSLAGIQSEIVFCLAPKDADPQSSPDLAQVGDCMAPGLRSSQITRVDCADPSARYRVLHRDDKAVLGAELACRSIRGTVSHYYKPLGGFKAYALCLGRI